MSFGVFPAQGVCRKGGAGPRCGGGAGVGGHKGSHGGLRKNWAENGQSVWAASGRRVT